MAYDKEALFPTRTGDSQGAGAERVMLDSLGGAAGVRTKVAPTPDGGEVLLRTRGGSPEFQSTSSHQVECLLGPLVEQDSMYAQRTWRTPLETDTPLVSSDGLITFWRTPLTKWVAQSKNKRVFELHFSSRFALPGDPAEPPSGNKIIEESWSNRTWHPAQIAQVVTSTLPLLHFVVTRMRSLALRWKRLKAFTWRFNTDGDPALVGNPPACMAQSGQEMGLSTRTAYAHGALQQLSLLILNHKGVLQTASPGGWLGALEGPPSVGDDPIELATMAGSNITPLSEATYFGQPWHGWMGTGGIDTLLGAHVLPAGYSFGGSNAAAYNEAGYETHYVAIPDLPAVPTGRLPDDPAGFPAEYDTQHMQFLTDAVLFGTTKRYSPQSSFSLGWNRWFHWSPDAGVHVLRLAVDRSPGYIRLKLYDDGVLTLWGVKGTPWQIGSEVLIPLDLESRLWSGQRIYDAYVPPGAVPYDKWRWVPLNTSPTGDRVLFQVVDGVLPDAGGLLSVWEGQIQADRSSWSMTRVWNYLDGFSVTPFGLATFRIHYELGACIRDEGSGPSLTHVYELWLAGYSITFSSMATDIETLCIGASYTPNGIRRLTKLELKLDKTQVRVPTFRCLVGEMGFPDGVPATVSQEFTLQAYLTPNSVRILDPDYVVFADTTPTLRMSRQFSMFVDYGSNIAPFAVNVSAAEFSAAYPTFPWAFAMVISGDPAIAQQRIIPGSNNTSLVALLDMSTANVAVFSDVLVSPSVAVDATSVVGIPSTVLDSLNKAVLGQISPWISREDPAAYAPYASFDEYLADLVYANPSYSLGYYSFAPRTGEVRGSLLPDIGYL